MFCYVDVGKQCFPPVEARAARTQRVCVYKSLEQTAWDGRDWRRRAYWRSLLVIPVAGAGSRAVHVLRRGEGNRGLVILHRTVDHFPVYKVGGARGIVGIPPALRSHPPTKRPEKVHRRVPSPSPPR